MHWPAMLAWLLAGSLGSYLAIQVAGWVGAYNAIAGSLLLPLAVLARMISYVAMLLVVRDGMRELDALSPLPQSRPERRRAWADALLVSVLPFFAFYAAWGFLRDDVAAYYQRLLDVNSGLIAMEVFEGQTVGDRAAGELTFGPLTIAIIVLAFALRWLFKKYRERLPKWTVAFALYLEVVWVFFFIYLVSDAIGWINGWVGERQGMVWLADFRATITSGFSPIAFLWEGVEWFIGEVAGITLLPLAWLAIAGVVYGRAVTPEAPTVRIEADAVNAARARYQKLPARLRARLSDVWSDFVGRFKPIWSALVLMWHAGTVLIGSYILLYTALLFAERWFGIGLTRMRPFVDHVDVKIKRAGCIRWHQVLQR